MNIIMMFLFIVICIITITVVTIVCKFLIDWIPSLSKEAKARIKKIHILLAIRDEADRQAKYNFEKCSNWDKRKLIKQVGG